MIPYGQQQIDDGDVEQVISVLRSSWLTQGPAVATFEQNVANACGAAHAVAVCNATTALHLACLALNIGPGDHVWTSPNTFVASANCARYCGAQLDFVDIDPLSLNMSPTALATKLAQAERQGRLPKLIIPVHFAGQPCDMAEISGLARQYGCWLIEDAAHAIGASYRGHRIGSGHYADMTVFSFHPVKIITTGEGGMVLTPNARLAARLSRLRNHGITREPKEMEQTDAGAWYYEQLELGLNARMTDLQAALGSSQLTRLAAFVQRRQQIAETYTEELAALTQRPELGLVCPQTAADRRSAWHLYPVRVRATERRRIFDHLRAAGIGVQIHYIPVHLQPYYRRLGFKAGDFPEAERYYQETISLPIFPGLSEAQQATVLKVFKDALTCSSA
ncbi:MAG: UDP-4-amino-4,6-dideoxy-N-acetyl-beta-L-altrosamine transaminase [Pseudomonadota bacterium]